MRRLKIITIGIFLSLTCIGCTNEDVASHQKCLGKKITETQWCEFHYMLNGQLVRPFTDGLRIKMVGQRPIVIYDNGEIAEKHVVVIKESKSVSREDFEFDCGQKPVYTYDGIRQSEEAKDYGYILQGWHYSKEYYE